MKRILALILALTLCLGCLLSCNDETPSESSSAPPSDSSSPSEESSSSSSSEPDPEPSVQLPNKTTVQVKQTNRYYRQISSGYSRTVAYAGKNKAGNAFSDGIFEMNQTSQYKILSSHSELETFSLLNYDKIESDLFEENRVVAILRYHLGPSADAKRELGFYNAAFGVEDGAKIELDIYSTGGDSTEDIVDVYTLNFIVVPKAILEGVQATGAVTVNAARLEQYDASVYKIDTTVESVEAYYVADSEAKEKTQILDGLRYLPSYPYIAIHLEEPIETDFVINSFKYENGEMYITVQIFDKEEKKEQYEFPSNLVVVSLQPHRSGLEISVPDYMPTNAWINVTFEYIS